MSLGSILTRRRTALLCTVQASDARTTGAAAGGLSGLEVQLGRVCAEAGSGPRERGRLDLQ